MKTKQQISKADRINEFMAKGRHKEAIPMLESELRRNPGDKNRRLLAICQIETNDLIGCFHTIETIENKTHKDGDLRQQAIERLGGRAGLTTVENIELLAKISHEYLSRSDIDTAAKGVKQCLDAWIQTASTSQAASGDFPQLKALINAHNWGEDDLFKTDPIYPAKLTFLKAWLISFQEHDTKAPNASITLLREVAQVWPDRLVYWELTNQLIQKQSWVEVLHTYHQYLHLAGKASSNGRLHIPSDIIFSISQETAQEICEQIVGILERLPAGEASENQAVVLLVEYCATILEKSGNPEQLASLIRVCPEWVFDQRSSILSRNFVDLSLREGSKSPEWMDDYLKKCIRCWENISEFRAQHGKVYYDLKEISMAVGEMKEAVRLFPENVEYVALLKEWSRIETISLRRSSDKLKLLKAGEREFLDKLIVIGKFDDNNFLMLCTGLSIDEITKHLETFSRMGIIFPEDDIDKDDRLDEGYFAIGNSVYRVLEDVVTQMIRERDASIDIISPPKESQANPKEALNIFRTSSEQIVYAALLRIYDPNEYIITINMNLSTLFSQAWTDENVLQKNKTYFYQTSIDFCVANKFGVPYLAVEVDGLSHNNSKVILKDREKNLIFQKAGIPFMRIRYPNDDLSRLTQDIKDYLSRYDLLS